MDKLRPEEFDNSTEPSIAKVIAACFALGAFAIATLAGLFVGNEALTVLLRALLAVMICYPVGLLAGFMADAVIREQLATETIASGADVANEDGEETSMPSTNPVDGEPAARAR